MHRSAPIRCTRCGHR
ncbi:hypothetical protein [Xanthomonas campestris]